MFLFTPDTLKKINKLPKLTTFEMAYESALNLRSGTLSEKKKMAYEELMRRKQLPKISFGGRDLFDKEIYSKPVTEQFFKSVVYVEYIDIKKEFKPGSKAQEIWTIYKPYINQMRANLILSFATWLFSLPVALFLFGWLVIWVLKGFTDYNVKS